MTPPHSRTDTSLAATEHTLASPLDPASGLTGTAAEQILAASGDAIVVVDTAGIVIGWSPAAERLFGHLATTAVGKSLNELIVPVDRSSEFSLFLDMVGNGGVIRLQTERRAADGTVLTVDFHATAITNDAGETVAIVASYRTAADTEIPMGSAHIDTLTGAATRIGLTSALDTLLSQRRRNDLAVVFVDLDGFKAINDHHGHQVGDEVLIEAVRRLQQNVRQGDIVARLGGDEFVALINDVDPQAIELFVERLLTRFNDAVDTTNGPVYIGVSVGVRTVRPREDVDSRTLLHDADLAMYDAKRRGKGRVVVFDESIRTRHGRAAAMADEIRAGLRRDEFRPWYQPLIDLATGTVVGAEALVRWHTKEGEIRPPGDFLSMASRLGVIGELDRQVMGHAFDELARWRSTPGLEHLFVTVNVTEVSLRRGAAAELCQALAARNLPPDRLCVEVTETAVGELDGEAIVEVAQMTERGIHIVVDDFGVAQASLSAIRDLPLSFLKLDRRFVSSFLGSVDDRAIVAATGSLAASLGMSAVAEGIEDVESVAPLIRYGFAVGQGYAFAPPVPDERFREMAIAGFPHVASTVDRDLRRTRVQTLRKVSSTGSFVTDMARHLGLDTPPGTP